MPGRKPYNFIEKKLVIAMDLGTTFSGVSYSILDPGRVPEIKGATRSMSAVTAKIPIIMYYDQEGNLKAVCAEALKQNVIEDAEDNGWLKFSLPPSTASNEMTQAILSLPDGMDVVAAFADFYAYLFDCTKTFILDTHQNAASIWKSLSQQSKMREAAIDAGLIPDDDGGHSRVRFVTEGEASLHFCINQGDEEGVVIVDAGGGTSPNTDSFEFEEISAPACLKVRRISVCRRVELIGECFDATTKLRFRAIEEASYIELGTMKDRDPKLDIRSGQLKLAGGWLFFKLKKHLEPLRIQCSGPDSHVNKAVADGALSFYLDHVYGSPVYTNYSPSDAEHYARRDTTFVDGAGVLSILGQFTIILPKVSYHPSYSF
ncbi:hypothetical protein DFS33DRAFT_1369960 [Desarmillaria ectypa]|nr:hypothetical protein DFS33DRAFT_1369960 [Desarmillaria ectypa]